MVVKLNSTFLHPKNQNQILFCQGNGQTAFWKSQFLAINLMHYGTAKLQHAKMLTCKVQSAAVIGLTQTLFCDYITKLMEMQLLLFKENHILSFIFLYISNIQPLTGRFHMDDYLLKIHVAVSTIHMSK